MTLDGPLTRADVSRLVEDLLEDDLAKLKARVAYGPWVAVTTFLNAWGNFGAGGRAAAYRKEPSGLVRLKGLVSGGGVPAVIFNLPVGFRPAEDNMHFPVAANSLYGTCRVDTNGDVRANSGSNVWFDLSTVCFAVV